MTDNETTETQNEQPEKKPRKPRSDKGQKRPTAKSEARKAAAKEAAEPKQPRSKKLPCFVRQDGKVIVLSGSDVLCRKMTPAQQAEWGIKEVSGKFDTPCRDEEMVLSFKSPKAADKFFQHCFGVEYEDECIIVAGSKTDWESESLSGLLD